MFTSIVVALDLEREGDRALPIVRSLSSAANGLPVELVTVQSPGLGPAPDAVELSRRLTANGWEDWNYTVLQDNQPARAIVQHVRSRPGSLLVMSTSAKSPLRQTFLGSVSEGVLSMIDTPVLLVGPRVSADVEMTRPTLVAAVDPAEPGSSTVTAIAAWVETFRGSGPWIVEVLPPPRRGLDVVETSHVHHIATLLADENVGASWEVLHGSDVCEELEHFAAEVNNPVFVTASANWTDDHTHWHSTTRHLVQRSTRPVLVIPARIPARVGPVR
jgi:nucleotide-binding universal stress UspA family protein